MSAMESSLDSEAIINVLLNLIDFNEQKNWKPVLALVPDLLNTNKKENVKLAWMLIQKVLNDFAISNCMNYEVLNYLPYWTKHFPSDAIALVDGIWPDTAISIKDIINFPIRQKVLLTVHSFLQDHKYLVDYAKLLTNITKYFNTPSTMYRGILIIIKLLSIHEFNIKIIEEFTETDFILLIEIMNCLIETPSKNSTDESRRAMEIDTTISGNMRGFYISLLRQDNTLVHGWTLEYLMRTTNVAELKESNILKEFLKATNRLELYNKENYFIPELQMHNFGIQIKQFFTDFLQVDWKGVPLHQWLHCMQCIYSDYNDSIQINQDGLLKISNCICKIKHDQLRQLTTDKWLLLFDETIKTVSLGEYIDFFEILFQKIEDLQVNYFSEIWNIHKTKLKIGRCNNLIEEINLRRRCIEKICDCCKGNELNTFYDTILYALNAVPKSERGWCRLLPLCLIHKHYNYLDFYVKEYDIDMQLFKSYSKLKKVQEKMGCISDDEKRFVQKRIVDVFVEVNLHKWIDIEELGLDPLELLETGTIMTFKHLTILLKDHKGRVENKVLRTIIDMWKKTPYDLYIQTDAFTLNILNYAKENLSNSEIEELLRDAFTNFNKIKGIIQCILDSGIAIPRHLLIQELLRREPMGDDARIEACYLEIHYNVSYLKQQMFISHAECLPKQELDAIIDELLRRNEKISKSGPVLENSIEHLTQIRIARCLFQLSSKGYWTDQYWNALLAPNNPLQVSFIYECLIARMLPSVSHLIEKLETLSDLKPKEQDALVSTAYIYCTLKQEDLKEDKLNNIVKILASSPLKLAELVVNNLEDKNNSDETPLPIESVTSPKLNLKETVLKFRLLLPKIADTLDDILYFSNVSVFERENYLFPNKYKEFSPLHKYRMGFKNSRFT